MSNGPDLHRIASYIQDTADNVLRDVSVRGKHDDVILLMKVLRRLPARPGLPSDRAFAPRRHQLAHDFNGPTDRASGAAIDGVM